MTGTRKAFSQKLHSENDSVAREYSKKALKVKLKDGVKIHDNPDQYGVDLILSYENRVIGYAECERKLSWDGHNFPFDTVQFPERKNKFADAPLPVVFCMINKNLTRALLVMGKTLASSPKKMVRNRYVPEGEYFFQVPVSKVMFVDLRETT